MLLCRNIINKNSLLRSTLTSIFQQPSMAFHNKFQRRPKKFSGYGFKPTIAVTEMIKRQKSRTFTRGIFKRFGLDEFENMKLILATRGENFRWLDEKKREQLADLFMRNLPELMAAEIELQGILITKIEVPDVFFEIRVYWRHTGDIEQDRIIQEQLDGHEAGLREQIREMFHNMKTPPFKFMPDRQHLEEDEMKKLFEMADYGMDYRAFSKIGRDTSRSLPDPEIDKAKARTPPRWLESWRKRIKNTNEKKVRKTSTNKI